MCVLQTQAIDLATDDAAKRSEIKTVKERQREREGRNLKGYRLAKTEKRKEGKTPGGVEMKETRERTCRRRNEGEREWAAG